MKKIINISTETINERPCGDCTACCNGWISGEAYGYKFYKGKKCHFVGTSGCSIHEKRPENPCVKFNCFWKNTPFLDESLRPDKCGYLYYEYEIDGIKFIRFDEMGAMVNVKVLNVFIQAALHFKTNILYQVDGVYYPIGSDEFINAVEKE